MSCMFKRLEAIFSMFLASSREKKVPLILFSFEMEIEIHIKGSYSYQRELCDTAAIWYFVCGFLLLTRSK